MVAAPLARYSAMMTLITPPRVGTVSFTQAISTFSSLIPIACPDADAAQFDALIAVGWAPIWAL
eukprot:XP_001704942.1 Hypothetical protein GL50803_23351 [Giardia lamblia ATCC 50803]